MLRRSGKMDGNVRCDKIWAKSLSSGNNKFTNDLVKQKLACGITHAVSAVKDID